MAMLYQLIRRSGVDRACVRCGYRAGPQRASGKCPMCGATSWRPLNGTPLTPARP
jgi:rubrerythrin